ncbi:GNAT family acetyltransferase [Sesbania bispinosa]|nr:GNAT family acetyltransferase [Sesbania bispinosa]
MAPLETGASDLYGGAQMDKGEMIEVATGDSRVNIKRDEGEVLMTCECIGEIDDKNTVIGKRDNAFLDKDWVDDEANGEIGY